MLKEFKKDKDGNQLLVLILNLDDKSQMTKSGKNFQYGEPEWPAAVMVVPGTERIINLSVNCYEKK